ncbi:NAD(P)/FAD-dependent oxidoreductase [Paenibacillus sp. GCM10023252]|uniref:NAD(P)/FAD-dependent oxidoreductase n=1 Tax=Paenibacillus sp. GCM10023252 TaxID=3252649 RepID=UPI00360E2491
MDEDCIIVGGGLAGLQAAIQLGRYQHRVLVIDSGQGRSMICKKYHNMLGWPDGVSGQELRTRGRRQAEELGVRFVQGEVVHASREEDGLFVLNTVDHEAGERTSYHGRRLLLATGVKDRIPSIEGLAACLGSSIYICPDCDGYEVRGKETLVIGSGDAGASMAIVLSYWTPHLTYINHDRASISLEQLARLQQLGIARVDASVSEVLHKEGEISAVRLASGDMVEASHAFVAFGGNQVRTELALMLGVEVMNNRHVAVDPRTKLTNQPHIWAAGDLVAHSEQAIIAMGDGSQAAIWIHKSLLG